MRVGGAFNYGSPVGEAMSRRGSALLLVSLMLITPLSGCFGNSEDGDDYPRAADLSIEEGEGLLGGVWNTYVFRAEVDLSVYIPYFLVDPGSKRAQNGTVLDMKEGESESVTWLLPPRNPAVILLIGEYGRTNWPVRAANQSWAEWLEDDTYAGAVEVVENGDDGGLWRWLGPSNNSGGPVEIKQMLSERPQRDDLGADEGVGASDGWVNGRDVYEWVDFITDDTPCATCGPDGAVGYLDRWIGNANPSYEHAITYFEGVMQGYGLDRVEVHRFQWNTAWAVNICGYKDGSVYPDEWLIFGAHFDIAPPVALSLIHISEPTRRS